MSLPFVTNVAIFRRMKTRVPIKCRYKARTVRDVSEYGNFNG